MIQLSGAGKRYGHKLLFENADWLITPESRIGLVGANGTGKSTIMKILAGSESLDYGAVSRAKGISTGYLPQDGLTLTGRTIFAECMSVFAELDAIEKEMESLTRSMSEFDHSGPEYSNVAERYQKLEHEFVARDGYTLEAQVGQVLTGLGFHRDDWTRQTEEFSGGWQMRVALAKLLLQKPNLLLLDEPTNHLDLEARNWLEEYLTTYPYAFVLISHDRYFLDITVKRIVEIWNKQIHFYAGNYDQYLAAKTMREDEFEIAYETQHDRIEQLEVLMDRFRYTATKAKQGRAALRSSKIERIQIPEEEKTVHFSFPQPKPSGRIVAEFADVARVSAIPELVTSGFRASDLHDRTRRAHRIRSSQRGREVHSHSTPSRSSAAEPGEYKLATTSSPTLAQDQYKELDPGARILDDLGELSAASTRTQLRSLFGCFLFSGDDVFERVRVVRRRAQSLRAARDAAASRRLPAARWPADHLDLRAKDVLLEALMKYTGTVVFVSRDRYFIDKLATRVFEIGESRVEIYPGNYEDYLWRKQHTVASSQLPVSSQFRVLSSQSQPNTEGPVERRNADRSLSKDAVATAFAAVPNGDEVAAGSLAVEPKAKRLIRSSASRWKTACTK